MKPAPELNHGFDTVEAGEELFQTDDVEPVLTNGVGIGNLRNSFQELHLLQAVFVILEPVYQNHLRVPFGYLVPCNAQKLPRPIAEDVDAAGTTDHIIFKRLAAGKGFVFQKRIEGENADRGGRWGVDGGQLALLIPEFLTKEGGLFLPVKNFALKANVAADVPKGAVEHRRRVERIDVNAPSLEAFGIGHTAESGKAIA